LYDVTFEEAQLCSLSIHVYPTDYSVDDSREYIEYFKVNGYVATKVCSPQATGCHNDTVEEDLHPCVESLLIDKLIDETGNIEVQGRNSEYVDECPYNGNLLSGVATVTCMVRNITETTRNADEVPAEFFVQDVLKCKDPGCTAATFLTIGSDFVKDGVSCHMNVTVQQTDFDGDLGSNEAIDFITVGNENISFALEGGANPCDMVSLGENVSSANRLVSVVKDQDITTLVQSGGGLLQVKGKITDMVDDCPYDNNQFYADVAVRCM